MASTSPDAFDLEAYIAEVPEHASSIRAALVHLDKLPKSIVHNCPPAAQCVVNWLVQEPSTRTTLDKVEFSIVSDILESAVFAHLLGFDAWFESILLKMVSPLKTEDILWTMLLPTDSVTLASTVFADALPGDASLLKNSFALTNRIRAIHSRFVDADDRERFSVGVAEHAESSVSASAKSESVSIEEFKTTVSVVFRFYRDIVDELFATPQWMDELHGIPQGLWLRFLLLTIVRVIKSRV